MLRPCRMMWLQGTTRCTTVIVVVLFGASIYDESMLVTISVCRSSIVQLFMTPRAQPVLACWALESACECAKIYQRPTSIPIVIILFSRLFCHLNTRHQVRMHYLYLSLGTSTRGRYYLAVTPMRECAKIYEYTRWKIPSLRPLFYLRPLDFECASVFFYWIVRSFTLWAVAQIYNMVAPRYVYTRYNISISTVFSSCVLFIYFVCALFASIFHSFALLANTLVIHGCAKICVIKNILSFQPFFCFLRCSY